MFSYFTKDVIATYNCKRFAISLETPAMFWKKGKVMSMRVKVIIGWLENRGEDVGRIVSRMYERKGYDLFDVGFHTEKDCVPFPLYTLR